MFSFARNNPIRPAAAAVKAPDELATLGLDSGQDSPKESNMRAKLTTKRANKRERYPKEQRISGSWISLS